MHVEARVTKSGVGRLVPTNINVQTQHGGSIVRKNDRFWNKNVSKRSMKVHSTSWVRVLRNYYLPTVVFYHEGFESPYTAREEVNIDFVVIYYSKLF